jgi:hypothetical protein
MNNAAVEASSSPKKNPMKVQFFVLAFGQKWSILFNSFVWNYSSNDFMSKGVNH